MTTRNERLGATPSRGTQKGVRTWHSILTWWRSEAWPSPGSFGWFGSRGASTRTTASSGSSRRTIAARSNSSEATLRTSETGSTGRSALDRFGGAWPIIVARGISCRFSSRPPVVRRPRPPRSRRSCTRPVVAGRQLAARTRRLESGRPRGGRRRLGWDRAGRREGPHRPAYLDAGAPGVRVWLRGGRPVPTPAAGLQACPGGRGFDNVGLKVLCSSRSRAGPPGAVNS